MSFDHSQLDQVAEVIDSLHRTPTYSADGLPMVRCTDVKYGSLNLNTTLRVDEDVALEFSRRYKPALGDIIITRVGTYGVTAIVKDTRFCLGQNTSAIVPRKIDPRYLYLALNSSFVWSQIEAGVVGSTQKTLSLKVIKSLKIPRFKKSLEAEIALIIGSFDDRIDLLHETNKTLEAIAQAIFKSWFVDFDPVRAKLEGREPEGMDAETAALFPDSFEESELGLIPKGWEVLPLTEVTTFREGSGILAKDFKEKGVPLIRLAGLKNGVSLLDGCNFLDPVRVEEKWSQFRLLKGDILLSSSASLGRVAEVDDEAVGAIPYTGIIGFRPIENKTFQRYVLQYLTSSYFQDQVSMMGAGSVLNHFGPTHLKKMTMLVPSLQTQSAFSDIVDPIKKAQYIQLKKADTLSNLRDTLLPRLISGQLRLPDAESMLEEAVL